MPFRITEDLENALLRVQALDDGGSVIDAISVGIDTVLQIRADKKIKQSVVVQCARDAVMAFWRKHAKPGDEMNADCKLLYPLSMARSAMVMDALANLGE